MRKARRWHRIFILQGHDLIGNEVPTKKHPEGGGTIENVHGVTRTSGQAPAPSSQIVGGFAHHLFIDDRRTLSSHEMDRSDFLFYLLQNYYPYILNLVWRLAPPIIRMIL